MNYFLNGTRVSLMHEFEYKDVQFAVVNAGDGEFLVCRKENLKKWEDTWRYQEEQKREQKLADYKRRHDEIVGAMQKKAINQLATRIKLNSVFGALSGDNSAIGVALAQELEKLIKENGVPNER